MMMKNLKIAVSLLSLFTLSSFKDVDPAQKLQTQHKDTIIHIVPDKLTVENVSNINSHEFDWGKNMPWIGAIFIGFATVGANLIISKLSRSSSLQIAEKQMELAKANSERDFKKTVISLNRQSWINDFRINISDLISLAIILATEHKFESEDHIKLLQLVTKTELMLSTETSHTNLSKLLHKLKESCIETISGNSQFEDLENIITDVKLLTLQIIKSEWEKALNAV